jgi:hypothetical protein
MVWVHYYLDFNLYFSPVTLNPTASKYLVSSLDRNREMTYVNSTSLIIIAMRDPPYALEIQDTNFPTASIYTGLKTNTHTNLLNRIRYWLGSIYIATNSHDFKLRIWNRTNLVTSYLI